jgi:hypothetical protein
MMIFSEFNPEPFLKLNLLKYSPPVSASSIDALMNGDENAIKSRCIRQGVKNLSFLKLDTGPVYRSREPEAFSSPVLIIFTIGAQWLYWPRVFRLSVQKRDVLRSESSPETAYIRSIDLFISDISMVFS